jgi:hypothetical protein
VLFEESAAVYDELAIPVRTAAYHNQSEQPVQPAIYQRASMD